MPVKRREHKRRANPSHEMLAWGSVFGCGWDLLQMLGPMHGEPHSCGDWTKRPETKAAWERLGAAYLAEHGPVSCEWAWDTFGSPPG